MIEGIIVKTAWQNGADRVELNSALYLGGLTPSTANLICAKEQCSIPIVTMVRPRGGGFCYSQDEYETMLLDARILLDHAIHRNRTQEMIDLIHSAGKEAVFHRAFDCVAQQERAVEALILLGADRILTSGGAPDVWSGRTQLQKLQSQYGKDITFLAGSGVNAQNVNALMEYTSIEQVHTSCRSWQPDATASLQDVDFSYDRNRKNAYEAVDAGKVKEMRAAMPIL